MQSHPIFPVLLVLAATLSGPAGAQTRDPHEIFERRCAGCHDDHAGSFARAHVAIEDDRLETVSARLPLDSFLSHHGGGLEAAEIEILLDLFRRQIRSGGLYQEKCGICHDPARDLAATMLLQRDGRLVGRYSGRDIAEFLRGHGRLTLEEAASMTGMLRRQLEDAGR